MDVDRRLGGGLAVVLGAGGILACARAAARAPVAAAALGVRGGGRAARARSRSAARRTPTDADAWFVELSAIVRALPRAPLRDPRARADDRGVPPGRDARARELTTEHRALLTAFLERCDRVKFAGYRPDADESLATLAAARGVRRGHAAARGAPADGGRDEAACIGAVELRASVVPARRRSLALPALYWSSTRSAGRVVFSSLRALPAGGETWRTRARVAARCARRARGRRARDRARRSAHGRQELARSPRGHRDHDGGRRLGLDARAGPRRRATRLQHEGAIRRGSTRSSACSSSSCSAATSLDGRPDDAIGLVAFARYADTRSPLTLDHANLVTAARQLDFARRGRGRHRDRRGPRARGPARSPSSRRAARSSSCSPTASRTSTTSTRTPRSTTR